MKRSWVAVLITVLLGALAGVAIAGRPSTVDQTIVPAPPSTQPTAGTSASAPTTTTTAAAPTTASPATSSPATSSSASTTDEPIDRTAVRVLVANAAGRAGIARDTADVLVTAGFTDSTPIDALRDSPTTAVYARPGFEAEAAAVAAALGLASATVQALGPTASTTDDSAGDVIVVIGGDFPS